MDDIPYDLHTMVDIVGEDDFLEICKMYGGSSVYIPVYRKAIMGHRNRKIVKEYNGRNAQDLRMKYNMSAQNLKTVLRKEGII